MAKKTRTPRPPRPVQAPQKRRPEPTISPERRRAYWIGLIAFAASGLIALAVVLGFVLTRGSSKGSSNTSGGVVNLASLPEIRHTKAPWDNGLAGLPDRLTPLKLTALPQEALNLHIHQHLDIYVNGKHVTVPQFIGIYDGQFITELHTHDSTGIMHVEAPKKTTYRLGQFFGVWGVYLSPRCIGGYCVKAPGKLSMYVNGKPYTGNPVALPLASHQEIAIVFGKPPKKIPSSYKFPAGY